MSDPTFNEISQFSHIGWGYLLTTVLALVFHVHPLVACAIVTTGAGIKEYSDAHGGETPLVAGNSWEDFAFWCVGIALGLLVLRISKI
jgi:hypothetical protein